MVPEQQTRGLVGEDDGSGDALLHFVELDSDTSEFDHFSGFQKSVSGQTEEELLCETVFEVDFVLVLLDFEDLQDQVDLHLFEGEVVVEYFLVSDLQLGPPVDKVD